MSWLYYDEETGAYSYPEDDDLESSDPEGDEEADEDSDLDGEPVGPDDLSDDGDALASVGWGTDEDYGPCDGGDEW